MLFFKSIESTGTEFFGDIFLKLLTGFHRIGVEAEIGWS